jgi:hypothetical protein
MRAIAVLVGLYLYNGEQGADCDGQGFSNCLQQPAVSEWRGLVWDFCAVEEIYSTDTLFRNSQSALLHDLWTLRGFHVGRR